jgi:hypothetical protein
MLNFHSVLKNSYASRDKQKGAFKNEGYVFDSDLQIQIIVFTSTQNKINF